MRPPDTSSGLTPRQWPKRAGVDSLTASEGVSTLVTNTRSIDQPTLGGGDADGTTAGDLGLPRRLRRHTRLPADRAGDRRSGWAGIAFDGPCPPCEPRASRIAQA